MNTADLDVMLEPALDGLRICSHERRRHVSASSYLLEELDLELDNGTRLELMMKNLGRLTEDGRKAKPVFLLDPLREIEVYRRILSPNGLGPKLYAADADRMILIIERVRGFELFQEDLPGWERSARWLAGLHTRFAEQAVELDSSARLRVLEAADYGRWASRAAEISAPGGAAGHLLECYEPLAKRLAAMPRTILHGEFYASNVLLTKDRVCPVDWEMAAVGPGLLDLAALCSGGWSDEDRRCITEAYRRELPEPPPVDRFLEELDLCRLQVAVQWLGWAKDWAPPPLQRNDWRAEANRIAARLVARPSMGFD